MAGGGIFGREFTDIFHKPMEETGWFSSEVA